MKITLSQKLSCLNYGVHSSTVTVICHRNSQISKAQEIVIPKLNEMAYEQVDLAGATFKDFIENKSPDGSPGNYSFVLRGYVHKWSSEIDKQFIRAEAIKSLTTFGNMKIDVTLP